MAQLAHISSRRNRVRFDVATHIYAALIAAKRDDASPTALAVEALQAADEFLAVVAVKNRLRPEPKED